MYALLRLLIQQNCTQKQRATDYFLLKPPPYHVAGRTPLSTPSNTESKAKRGGGVSGG
jgi:hypothetical protein